MAGKRSRELTAEEVALWRAAMEHTDRLPWAAQAEPAPAEPGTAPSEPAVIPAATPRSPAPVPGGGLDKRRARRLRRGELPIDGRLDLHGMTQDAAHRALRAFLLRAQASGERCVLVITGKGRTGAGPGVLRTMLPRWLRETPLAGAVLAWQPAQPRHGGEGAAYVLLRRKR